MKKISLLFAATILSCMATFAQGKTLVAYFSATGTTEQVAKQIAVAVSGDLHEITPTVPYTSDDLDWHDDNSRSSREMADVSSRPPIENNLPGNAGEYDTIYLGYPIWWNQAPRVINSFLETHNLNGKTVIPFATSGGSPIDNSVEELKKTYPNIKWSKGKLLNHVTNNDIKNWIKTL